MTFSWKWPFIRRSKKPKTQVTMQTETKPTDDNQSHSGVSMLEMAIMTGAVHSIADAHESPEPYNEYDGILDFLMDQPTSTLEDMAHTPDSSDSSSSFDDTSSTSWND